MFNFTEIALTIAIILTISIVVGLSNVIIGLGIFGFLTGSALFFILLDLKDHLL
jgi:hypothetical protein